LPAQDLRQRRIDAKGASVSVVLVPFNLEKASDGALPVARVLL
jgi:hypothetical protein